MSSTNFEPLPNIDDRYPLPIAQTYRSLTLACTSGASKAVRFLRLKDCFETISRYLALALVAVYVRSDKRNTDTDRSIIRKLVRPSTGDWPTIISELTPMLTDTGYPLVGETYQAFFVSTDQPDGKPHRRKQVMSDLLDFPRIRNEYLGHSLTRQESEYEAVVDEWGGKLNNILCEADFLARWDLIYAMGVASGENWMGRIQPEYDLPLNRDLPPNLAGRFLLINNDNTVDLNPFILRLRCPHCNAIRLCVYDSQHRYTGDKKSVRLVEFPEAHRFSSSEPVSQLETIFGSSLMKQEYVTIYARLREVEGRILDQSKFIEEHADIVGRSFLDDRINRFLSERSKGIFFLTGQPGIGKTAYLSNYMKRHAGNPHFFFSRASGFTSLDDGIKSIYYQIQKLLDRADLSPAESASEQLVKLRNLLTGLDSSALAKVAGRLVIVLDAIDEATTSSIGIQPLDLLSISLPDGVYFLVSSRENATVFSLSTHSEVSRFHIDSTSEENLKDAEDYVTSHLDRYGLDTGLMHHIARSSEGNFLILKHIVGNLLIMIEEEPEKFHSAVEQLIQHPAGSLEDFYTSLWDQIIHSRESDLEATRAVVDVIGLLSIAKSPLQAEDLALILRHRQFEIDLAVEQLRPFLEVRSEETAGELSIFYRPYHSTFADYVRERLGHDIRRYHLALIRHCQQGEPEEYLQRYCRDYLPQHIVESESISNVVSQGSFEELRPLLSREIALARRKTEGSFSGFIRDVDRAVELAKQGGLRTFPELLEFCFIKSSIMSAMSEIPADIFAALLILDGIERAVEAVESIGDKGHRAQAYASLSLVCPDDSKRREFVQKALELAEHSGDTWEIAENLSFVGRLLVRGFPTAGTNAIRNAFEIIKGHHEIGRLVIPAITEGPIEHLIFAYEIAPNELAPIVSRVVKIVVEISGAFYLLDLACTLSETNRELTDSILESVWQELENQQLSSGQSDSRREYADREFRDAQAKYAEVLTLIGRQDLAEERFPEFAGKLNLSALKKAVDLLNNRDYSEALLHSDHLAVRRRGLRGLLASGKTEEAIELVKQNPRYSELDVLVEFIPAIVKQGLHLIVLKFARDLQEKRFYKKGRNSMLIAAIARELSGVEPESARSIVEEFHGELSPRREIPYWVDLALIAAAWYRKGPDEAKRYISLFGFESLEEMKTGISLFGFNSFEEFFEKHYVENVRKLDQQKTRRKARKEAGPDIPSELKKGWKLLGEEKWNELRQWIDNVQFDEPKQSEAKVELVGALAEAGQEDLAWLMASRTDSYTRRHARAQIEAVSLRNGVDINNLSIETDYVADVIVKAEGLAHRSVSLACSYVRVLGDWLLAERQADDLLAYGLSRIALFLYQHGNSAEAERYFLFGYRHLIENVDVDMIHDLLKHELSEFIDELPFQDRFSILQEIIVFCGSRSPKEIAQFVDMFADALVLNLPSSKVERILLAIQRSRDWMIVDRS